MNEKSELYIYKQFKYRQGRLLLFYIVGYIMHFNKKKEDTFVFIDAAHLSANIFVEDSKCKVVGFFNLNL